MVNKIFQSHCHELLLNYKNDIKNSHVSITAAYHNEGMDMPISPIAFIKPAVRNSSIAR